MQLIIELGIASVQWRAGNAIPPAVKAEHISGSLVLAHLRQAEHYLTVLLQSSKSMKTSATGHTVLMRAMSAILLPPARKLTHSSQRFVFGQSKYLSEDKLPLYLKYKMVQLAKNPDVADIQQPLIVLVHDARSEKQYFELMGISLSDFAERVPTRLLEPILDEAGNAVFKARDRKDKLLFDTQRLWKAYLLAMEVEMEKPPLSLGGICKKLGINVKYLHNAGQ